MPMRGRARVRAASCGGVTAARDVSVGEMSAARDVPAARAREAHAPSLFEGVSAARACRLCPASTSSTSRCAALACGLPHDGAERVQQAAFAHGRYLEARERRVVFFHESDGASGRADTTRHASGFGAALRRVESTLLDAAEQRPRACLSGVSSEGCGAGPRGTLLEAVPPREGWGWRGGALGALSGAWPRPTFLRLRSAAQVAGLHGLGQCAKSDMEVRLVREVVDFQRGEGFACRFEDVARVFEAERVVAAAERLQAHKIDLRILQRRSARGAQGACPVSMGGQFGSCGFTRRPRV